MTNKYVSRVLYLSLQTTEISFESCTIAISVHLFQLGPSVPSFVFAGLFKPFVNVLSGYFYVLLNLVARSQWLNLAKFRDTAPLRKIEQRCCVNE